MSNDEVAFLARIAEHPLDEFGRNVFADWLEEHDRPEEAARQRAWVAAWRWMETFAVMCDQTCDNYGEGYYYDQEGRPREVEGYVEQWRCFTVEEVVKAGSDFIDTDGQERLTQLGREDARGLFWAEYNDGQELLLRDGKTLKECYWENWAIITGRRVPEKPFDEWSGTKGKTFA